MKKILFFLLATFWSFGLIDTPVMASGKMHVLIGEEIVIEAQSNISSANITWKLFKDGEFVTSQDQRKFKYRFTDLGDFELNVTAQKDLSSEETTLWINVSANPPVFTQTGAVIETLPSKSASDGKVHLFGDEGEVIFFFLHSTGVIKNYAFEGDIYTDYDDNGVIDDDIENRNDPSYFTGTSFARTYINEGKPIQARLTITDEAGKVDIKTIDIVFDSASTRKEKPLQALLQTIPASDESGILHLSGESVEVTFLSNASLGDVVQYRIDRDISLDTNGDGKKDNDVDNREHLSFQDGSAWTAEFKKEDTPVTVQLITVDSSGRGSLVQKRIVFDDDNRVVPVLVSSKNSALEGATVNFSVFNASEGTVFSWDFDGDGTYEIERSEYSDMVYRFSDAGEYVSAVLLLDVDGKETLLKQVITIDELNQSALSEPPKAVFTFTVEGNKVIFDSSQSTADNRMPNTDLSFSWDFGDGNATQGPNPEHKYEEVGEYSVVLTVEDSMERVSHVVNTVMINSFEQSPFEGDEEEGVLPLEDIVDEFNEDMEEGDLVNVSKDDYTEEVEGMGEKFLDNVDAHNVQENLLSSLNIPSWGWILLLILGIPLLLIIRKKIEEPDRSFNEIVTGASDNQNFDKHNDNELSSEDDGSTVEMNSNEVPDWMRVHEDTNISSMEDQETVPDWLRNPGADLSPAVEVVDTSMEENIDSSMNAYEDNILEGNESFVSKDVYPEWLHDISDPKETVFSNEGGDKDSMLTMEEGDLPDWLKGGDSVSGHDSDIVSSSDDLIPMVENFEDNNISADSREGDLPEWMNHGEMQEDPIKIVETEGGSNEGIDDTLPVNATNAPVANIQNNDLPDWLSDDFTQK